MAAALAAAAGLAAGDPLAAAPGLAAALAEAAGLAETLAEASGLTEAALVAAGLDAGGVLTLAAGAAPPQAARSKQPATELSVRYRIVGTLYQQPALADVVLPEGNHPAIGAALLPDWLQ